MHSFVARSGLAALGLALMQAPLAAQATARLEPRFTPAANLAYQLDCVSGAVRACGADDYRALWTRDFLRTRGDSAQLRAWTALRARYRASYKPERAPGSADTRAIDVDDKLRIASLQSTTVSDLVSRLELLLAPADWQVARVVLRHFEAPFRAWWTRDAEGLGAPFVEQMRATLEREEVGTMVQRLARVVGTTAPLDEPIPMQLLLRPQLVVTGTSGQQIERYSVVEFLPGEAPGNRLDVAVHELVHYYYGERPAAADSALRARLRATGSPAATVAINVMNEALATALGNAIFAALVTDSTRLARRLATPLGLYNNPNVDRAAKAILPLVHALVADGGTIDDPAFAASSVRAIADAFGEGVSAPALVLNELYFFSDRAMGADAGPNVRRALRTSSMYDESGDVATATFADFRQQPELNALFMITPASIAALRTRGVLEAVLAERLAQRARSGDAVVHVTRRPSGSWWFFIVAKGPAAAERALATLARMSSSALTP
jgi:hypothetical protein